jgi:hypothetical protein
MWDKIAIMWRDPRWWLEGGSRQRELHKSKILLRYWSHTWQKKNTKKKQSSDTPNPQPTQSFSMPHYTEKPGGLLHHQTPLPNMLGRSRAIGKQISHPWGKSAEPPGQTDPLPTNKIKQNWIISRNWKGHTAKRAGCLECTGEGGESKELLSVWSFSKQSLQRLLEAISGRPATAWNRAESGSQNCLLTQPPG